MDYLPAARRCQRVAFSIFLCFFLRMRLRRFLISDPMSPGTLVDQEVLRHVGPAGVVGARLPRAEGRTQSDSSPASRGAGTSGRLKRKTAPPPSARYTFTLPPSSLATWATMANPSPEPGLDRAPGAR